MYIVYVLLMYFGYSSDTGYYQAGQYSSIQNCLEAAKAAMTATEDPSRYRNSAPFRNFTCVPTMVEKQNFVVQH